MKTDFNLFQTQRAQARIKYAPRPTPPLRFWLGALAACALWLGNSLAQGGTFTVTNKADSGEGSLRQAIFDANASTDSSTILFAPTAYGTITLTSGQFIVTNSLTILGPGAASLLLDGNVSSRIFHVAAPGTVLISGLTLTNGLAMEGGGLYNDHSEVIISNCTLTGNVASPGAGAGIVNDGSLIGSATLTLISSTISGNRASDGGGAILSMGNLGSTKLTVLNSTISGNSASFAGAIWNDGEGEGSSADLTIYNSTICSNSAGLISGGLLNDSLNSGTGTLMIGSTIMASNSIENLVNNLGTITSLGYNLSSDDGSGLLNQPTDLLNTNPLLGPLQFNGGPTQTHALQCGSPAISAGTNFTGLANDQRGAGFSRTVGRATDIGAFELDDPRTFTVVNKLDSGPGSLRQAILDAKDCPGKDIIVFDPSAYGTITLTSGALVIGDDLCLLGPGPAHLVIDGNNPVTTNRVFEIGPGLEVTIAGLTVTNGFSDLNSGLLASAGGGILNADSSLVVSNCWVTGNSVGYKGSGGGICSFSLNGPASLLVIDSIVSSNRAGIFGSGAGISSVGLSNVSLTVLNSTVNYNTGDTDSFGVGIVTEGAGDVLAQIINSTISGNSTLSGGTGGGFANLTYGGLSQIQFVNCTLSDNAVGSDGGEGGGIANVAFDGTATVQVVSTILKAGTVGSNLTNTFSGSGQASITSLGFNLSSDDGGGYLTQSSDLVNTDPLLGPLQNNGGPTLTHALRCGSPAIDSGTNLLLLATDQRGEGFSRTFGAAIDIGAFELQNGCNHSPVALCSNVTVSANSGCLAMASIDAGSYDPDSSDTITLSQNPAGPYPLGTNLVQLTVIDNKGASNSCSSLVIVVDTTPPTLSCPGNLVVNANTPDGTVVNYPAIKASDNCGLASTNFSKNAGSVFPIGTTTVLVQVIDNSGNSNSCSFTVKVKSAAEQVSDLITLVNGLSGVKSPIKNALVVKLNAAQKAITNGDTPTACSSLQDFVALAMSQASKKELTSSQATLLISEATRIRGVLACL